MRKTALTLAPALAMYLGLCVPVSAASSDFTIENGVLTKYNGPGGDVIIPDSVTSIRGETFFGCTGLSSVIIPNSVTNIRGGAFWGCTGLSSVTIPNSVTSIEGNAFRYCTGLTNVTIPDSVTIIESYTFKDCTALTNIIIPNSVTSIKGGAFEDCSALTDITIPDSVISIGAGAFNGCGLTSVIIPDSVTSIGRNVFINCNKLTDVYYTGTKAQWDTIQIDRINEALTSAQIHYADDTQQEPPAVIVEHIPASGTAYASTQTVTVDGKAVEFQMYALKDAAGNLTNYIKLRDMAYILNGTKAQFAVGYDGTISLTTGRPYQPGGTEMTTPYSGDRAYTGGAQTVKVDGRDVSMTAITLTDDNGGGYNYFKLRDLGQVLGFNVYWANGQGVSIQTDRPYTGQAG